MQLKLPKLYQIRSLNYEKIISVCLMAVLLLLPLQIIALGDEQHDQNTQGTGEFIVETAEGLNNLESDAKKFRLVLVDITSVG